MAFISISITKNHPLILGKGGFGRQLADWLSAEGWGERNSSMIAPPAAWAACVTTPTLSC